MEKTIGLVDKMRGLRTWIPAVNMSVGRVADLGRWRCAGCLGLVPMASIGLICKTNHRRL